MASADLETPNMEDKTKQMENDNKSDENELDDK